MSVSTSTAATTLRFRATERHGEVSALLVRPREARAMLVLAHGAGANMRHAFMEAIAARLAHRAVASLRYQFPYMERGGGGPDPQPVLLETVRAAVGAARQVGEGIPLFAGGKSMGGRMTSLAAADEPLAEVRGIVFFGFPLHSAGRPATGRALHLPRVTVPMLFLQGTRDHLAHVPQLRPICERLHATLHVVNDADHSFHVLKRTGRTDEEVLDELADVATAWMAGNSAGG